MDQARSRGFDIDDVYYVLVLIQVALIDEITQHVEIRKHRQRKENDPQRLSHNTNDEKPPRKCIQEGYIHEGIIMKIIMINKQSINERYSKCDAYSPFDVNS